MPSQEKPTRASTQMLTRILRRRKMGLILSKLARICLVFYILGVAGIGLLPSRMAHRPSYVDENALMPGATAKYSPREVSGFLADFRGKLKNVTDSDLENPIWFKTMMDKLGIQSHLSSHGKDWHVSAVFRAPRADGTEALLLSAPFYCDSTKRNVDGIAYLYTFAWFVQKYSFWARDILFVVSSSTEHLKNYIDSYYGVNDDAEILHLHAGLIEQSINLEFCENDAYNGVGYKFEALNGQLSNLDLMFAISRINRYSGTPTYLHSNIITSNTYDDTTYYFNSLRNLLQQVKHQVLGMVTGGHAFWPKFGVDSVTLKGLKDPRNSYTSVRGINVMGMLEDSFRTLNNLLEHLHHSMFFYLLPNVDSYTPISLYSPIIVLLLLPLILLAIGEFIPLSTPEKEDVEFVPVENDENKFVVVGRGWSRPRMPVWEALGVVLVVYLLGIAVYASFLTLGSDYHKLFHYVVSISSLPILLTLSHLVSKYRSQTAPITKNVITQHGLKTQLRIPAPSEAVSLGTTTRNLIFFSTALIILALSVLNFALAAVLAVVLVPLYVLSRWSIWRVLRVPMIWVSCPATWFVLLDMGLLNDLITPETLYGMVDSSNGQWLGWILWGLFWPAVVGVSM